MKRLRTSSVSLNPSIPYREGSDPFLYGTVTIAPRYATTKTVYTREKEQEIARQREAMAKQYDSTKQVLSASKPHQSSPQQLLEWLEGRPATSTEEKLRVAPYPNKKVFNRELVGEELRAFFIKNEERTEVYTFRVVGGEFGSSGAETLVNPLSAYEGYAYDRVLTKSQARELAEEPEAWDDEWVGHYEPSTSIDNYRVTTHWYPDEEEQS